MSEKETTTSENVKEIARYAAPVIVIAMGMVGLYFNIEYSGWVLFIGLLGLFG